MALQIRGDKVDGLSDIFSLGVIVYEMAAGNRPFMGESLATISNRILSQMPCGRSRFWLPSSIRKCHRRWTLDAVLVQAMTKDKAKRFATAKAFAEALHALCALKDLNDLPRRVKGAQEKVVKAGEKIHAVTKKKLKPYLFLTFYKTHIHDRTELPRSF